MTNRILILVVVIAIVAALCVCGVAGILAVGRDTFLAREPETTATPTKTPKPTFTVTLTPTQTPIPTNTPIPTDTPTPTDTPLPPTPTFTLVPPTVTLPATSTPSPMPPTNTPKPTPKPTRRPTSRPQPTPKPTQKPPPTQPPQPQFAWTGTPAGSFANCGTTQFIGLTLDNGGGTAGDIVVHYWADGWNGDWAVSSWTVDEGYAGEGDEKNWDGILGNNYARPGTWYACVVPEQGSWNCISNTMTAVTVAEPCEPDSGGVQVVRIVFRKN